MRVVYAGEEFPRVWSKAIFLAGPTPRDTNTLSWRPEALRILEAKGFDGVVFVPECADGKWKNSYDDQVKWEDEGLNFADCILFWIPRDLATMPALTTNHEHGEWFKSGKIVLGAPKTAAKMEYLLLKAAENSVPLSETLEGTIAAALTHIGPGAEREDGERYIPIHLWRTKSFWEWLTAVRRAGNRLEHARAHYAYFMKRPERPIFMWAIRAGIWIAAEGRVKTENVISRPDTASVLLFHRNGELLDTEIVLVREARVSAATRDGYVWELPSGSSHNPAEDLLTVALKEVEEETGLKLERARLRTHECRQLMATLSAHKSLLFVGEITADEIAALKAEAGKAHGVAADGERTFVEIRTLREIIRENLVDWATVGMISSALLSDFSSAANLTYPVRSLFSYDPLVG